MCRFLDAGGTEALHTRGGPASKKRQGAKSRGAGQRLGGERYGDFRLGPHSMGRDIAATRPAWLHATAGERTKEASRAGFEGRQRAPGALMAMNRVERDRRRRGAGATEWKAAALTAVWFMMCRSRLGSVATVARSLVRTPRSRSCGRRSAGMGSAAHAARPVWHPAAVAGRRQAGRRRAARGLLRCCQRGWRWRRARSGGCGDRRILVSRCLNKFHDDLEDARFLDVPRRCVFRTVSPYVVRSHAQT